MKRVKEFFSSIDGTSICYMIAGMLMLIGIAELCLGHYLRAVNSFLYTFITFMTSVLMGQNKRLMNLIVMQHLIIRELEKKLGGKNGDDEKNNSENNQEKEDAK